MSHNKGLEPQNPQYVKITFEPAFEDPTKTPIPPRKTKWKRSNVITMTKGKAAAKREKPPTRSKGDQRKEHAKTGKKSAKQAKGKRAGGIRTAQILGLLKKPGGATLKDMMSATAWQVHSVRGFLSGVVGKKLGLNLRSERRDGTRFYSL